MNSLYYSLKEVATKLEVSRNLIYRRLTEKPQMYRVKGVIKNGGQWKFSKQIIDSLTEKNEPVIEKITDFTEEDFKVLESYIKLDSKRTLQERKSS